jgi:GT2 family glycosyltransferase
MKAENKSALVIGVNYFNESDTIQFVNEFLSQERDCQLKIVIVNNGSNDDEFEKLQQITESNESVTIYQPNKNLGFYGGINHGLDQYLSSNSLPDFVIASNTDVFLSDESFLEKLCKLSFDDDVGVIAPSVISSLTGIDQNPQIESRPSTKRWLLYRYIYRNYVLGNIYLLSAMLKNKLRGKIKPKNGKSRMIYAPHGSFVIIRKCYFESGCDIEHGAFMFGETITIAEKARRHGIKVLYQPLLKIFHREHSTTGIFRSKKMMRYQWEAADYTYRKYFEKNV